MKTKPDFSTYIELDCGCHFLHPTEMKIWFAGNKRKFIRKLISPHKHYRSFRIHDISYTTQYMEQLQRKHMLDAVIGTRADVSKETS